MPDGIILFDTCLNDVLHIASAVKDTDDVDLPLVVIDQIINGVIIHRKEAHLQGSPWSHSTVVCPSGKRSRERMDSRIRFTWPSAYAKLLPEHGINFIRRITLPGFQGFHSLHQFGIKFSA